MTDHVSPEGRSRIMALVGVKDTKPEKLVRLFLHKAGFRFRLHSKNLPGRPDIVLPKWGTVVLVHGCFWHRHPGCRKASVPKSNTENWLEKFRRNVRRDARVRELLEGMGWRVEVVWECEADPNSLGLLVERIRGSQSPA